MPKLRIGHIHYINTYPLFYTLLTERNHLPFEIVSNTPARLNSMMREGLLDVSLISSFEYAVTPNRYLIYSEFCLASLGYVNSVLLIAKKEIEALQGARIGLSDSSATSANLLKIILKEFYGFSNTFMLIPSQEEPEVGLQRNDAILIIGDEALSFSDNGTYHLYDLGELWTRKTGFPVVFALIAINHHASRAHPSALSFLFTKFQESHHLFQTYPEVIANFARNHSSLKIDFLDYFSHLTYTFSDELKKGLLYYYQMLAKHGLAPETAQLRFYQENRREQGRRGGDD